MDGLHVLVILSDWPQTAQDVCRRERPENKSLSIESNVLVVGSFWSKRGQFGNKGNCVLVLVLLGFGTCKSPGARSMGWHLFA